MTWHIFDAKTLEPVKPRTADGRSQADIAHELAELLDSYDVVILEASPGSGKTLIVLSACFEHCPDGKIVYNTGPYRARQVQVARDFTERFLVGDGEKFWTFGIVWGRDNFRCPRTGLCCSEAPCRDRSRRHEYPCYAPPVRGRSRVGERNIIAEWVGIDGSTWCLPETDCPYYRQFTAYQDSDVVVMNSFMWLCETLLGRKVRADVEVIDEFDAVLQEVTPRIVICESHLKMLRSLIDALPDRARRELEQELRRLRRALLHSYRTEDVVELVYAYQRVVLDLATLFPDEFADDEELRQCLETARKLRAVQLSVDSYIPVRRGTCLVLTCVDSEKHVRNILSMCGRKKILISATPPPEPVLEHVYGLRDYAYIRAGRGLRGLVYLGGTFEIYVYGRLLRAGRRDHVESYRRALRDTIRLARMDGYEPRLIVATSRLHLDYLYIDLSIPIDWNGRKLQEFIDGKLTEVATTRAYRAIDLPGDKCRSIIITKCPWPDLEDPWWVAASKKLEKVGYSRDLIEHLYRELTKHNLLQIIGRALRSEDDWVWLYSPDKFVLELLIELEREGKVRIVRDVVPETRRIIQEVLNKIEKGDIASIEIPDQQLRAKVRHILETYFYCTVHEVENYLIAVHKSRQSDLEQELRKLIQDLESQVDESPNHQHRHNNLDNSNLVNNSSNENNSNRGTARLIGPDDLVIVFFRSDCGVYRRGDVAAVPRDLLENCPDVDVLDLGS